MSLILREDYDEVIGSPFATDYRDHLFFTDDNQLIVKGKENAYSYELFTE